MKWRTFLLRSAQDGLDLERGLRLVGGSPSGNARLDDHEPEDALASARADELFWRQGEKVVVVHLRGMAKQCQRRYIVSRKEWTN